MLPTQVLEKPQTTTTPPPVSLQTQATTTVVEQPQAVAPTPTVDLITRVSQFKKPETPKKDGEDLSIKEPEFNIQDIDKIADPVAKEQALKAYKSFQRGFNQKFQEIAELRKALESQKGQSQSWTSDRIQQLLQDPEFIKASQEVLQKQAPSTWDGSQQEWSGLNDSEKLKFQHMEAKVQELERSNYISKVRAQDETLKTRYANFNPEAIDILTSDLLAGKVQATREHLHKVIDYEPAVQRSYDLGYQDGMNARSEKANSTTLPTGANIQPTIPIPEVDKNESGQNYFRRLVLNRLTEKK